MEFEYTPKVIALRDRLLEFMDEHVYPNEQRHDDELAANAKAGRASAEAPARDRNERRVIIRLVYFWPAGRSATVPQKPIIISSQV